MLKPDNVQLNTNTRDTSFDIAFGGEGVTPKNLNKRALFCFADKGIISRHFAP